MSDEESHQSTNNEGEDASNTGQVAQAGQVPDQVPSGGDEAVEAADVPPQVEAAGGAAPESTEPATTPTTTGNASQTVPVDDQDFEETTIDDFEDFFDSYETDKAVVAGADMSYLVKFTLHRLRSTEMTRWLYESRIFTQKLDSTVLPDKKDQSLSASCWVEAGNSMFERLFIIRNSTTKPIPLSPKFIRFHDIFYKGETRMLQLAKMLQRGATLRSQDVQELQAAAITEGGGLERFLSITKKHGHCPLQLYPDTCNSSNPGPIMRAFEKKLKRLSTTLFSTRGSPAAYDHVAVKADLKKIKRDLFKWLCRPFGGGPPKRYIEASVDKVGGGTADVKGTPKTFWNSYAGDTTNFVMIKQDPSLLLKKDEMRHFAPKGPSFQGDSFVLPSLILHPDRFLNLLGSAAEKGASFAAMQYEWNKAYGRCMAKDILADDTSPSEVAEVGVDNSSKFLTAEHRPHHAVCITLADFFKKEEVEGGAAGGQAALEKDKDNIVRWLGLLNSHSDSPYAIHADYAKDVIFHAAVPSALLTKEELELAKRKGGGERSSSFPADCPCCSKQDKEEEEKEQK